MCLPSGEICGSAAYWSVKTSIAVNRSRLSAAEAGIKTAKKTTMLSHRESLENMAWAPGTNLKAAGSVSQGRGQNNFWEEVGTVSKLFWGTRGRRGHPVRLGPRLLDQKFWANRGQKPGGSIP